MLLSVSSSLSLSYSSLLLLRTPLLAGKVTDDSSDAISLVELLEARTAASCDSVELLVARTAASCDSFSLVELLEARTAASCDSFSLVELVDAFERGRNRRMAKKLPVLELVDAIERSLHLHEPRQLCTSAPAGLPSARFICESARHVIAVDFTL